MTRALLTSRIGFMRGSRNFCQAGGGGGGGGGMGSRLDDQKTVWTMFFFLLSTYFTVYRVDQMVLLQRGGGVQLLPGGGGVHITCDFPEGGSGPPNPPLDPHVGSPDATVCLQNHGLSKF